jgi:hypothetical protein
MKVMKRNLYTTAILIAFSLYATKVFSQFNPMTNSFAKQTVDEATPVNQMKTDDLLTGVSCTPNSFWAIASTGASLFTLSGGVITYASTISITGSFDPNLAYCNNLNGGAFGPTFYSTINYNQPVYYNGSGVTVTSTISPNKLINCGGSGDYLYYIEYDTAYKALGIVRYNGSSISTVYSFNDSITTTVADMAVDSLGNVYFFTGRNNELYNTDTLNVVSPGGQVIKKYPFAFNTLNAYGCFLLNSKLYVGLGGSNIAHPNTVLPITITASSATAGTPIAMPVTTTFSDMASCMAGSPFSIEESNALEGTEIYPNPVTTTLTIEGIIKATAEVYDISGKLLLAEQLNTNQVDISSLAKGLYFIKLNTEEGSVVRKFVKE